MMIIQCDQQKRFIEMINSGKNEYQNSLKTMLEEKDKENEEKRLIQEQEYKKLLIEIKKNNEIMLQKEKEEREKIEKEIKEEKS